MLYAHVLGKRIRTSEGLVAFYVQADSEQPNKTAVAAATHPAEGK